MNIGTEVIRGAVKLDGFLGDECYESIQDLIPKLVQHLTVEVPNGITNVTIGFDTPSDSERDHLWIKTDGVNNFVGLFIYIKGSWRQVYPAPAQYVLINGDSREPPDGYISAADDPNTTPEQLLHLQSVWTIGGTVPTTWYSVYHAVYKGF